MAAYDDIDQLFELLDAEDPVPGPAFRATLDLIKSGQLSVATLKPASRSRRFRLIGLLSPVVAAALVIAFVTVAVSGTGNNLTQPQQNFNAAPVVATVEDLDTGSVGTGAPLSSEANSQIASPAGRSNVVSSTRSKYGDQQLQRLMQLEQLSRDMSPATTTKVKVEISNVDLAQPNRPPPSRTF